MHPVGPGLQMGVPILTAGTTHYVGSVVSEEWSRYASVGQRYPVTIGIASLMNQSTKQVCALRHQAGE